MTSTSQLKPKPMADYQLEQLDDEFLLYHPAIKKVMYCNNTASLIWQLCNGERTASEIVMLIDDAFETDRSVVEAEVLQTLETFFQHGAIMWLGENGQAVSDKNVPQ